MTKFSKALVVFAVFGSFAILGFAWVSLMGGPNWSAEAAAVDAYTFDAGEALEPKWTVTERTTGQQVTVSQSQVQGAAIVAARTDLKTKQQKQIEEIEKQTQTYQAALAQVKSLQDADLKTLDARVKEFDAQLDELNSKLVTMSNEIVKRSQEAQALRTETGKRREEVFRLKHELEEINADLYRSGQLKTKLDDQLARLTGVVDELNRRQRQLQDQGATTASR